jgi:short-subunit dehydrogenase
VSVVLVTGASSGIGRATARLLAREGTDLVLASRSAPALAATQAECEALGASVLVSPTDVTEAAEVGALLDQAVARFGRVDAVVHAAAVLAYGRFEDVPADVFDRVQVTNIIGTANVARGAMQTFRKQRGGTLVVVGSVTGKIAAPFLSSYTTSKWAVHGLVRVLQVEARRTPGVSVTLVSPGGVDTPIYLAAGNYAGRVGRPPPPVDSPEKVARAIVRALDRPRREVSVGLANAVMVTGFRLLPGLYDAMVTPLMERAALSREPVAPHSGNVFRPPEHGEAVHGRWGRHWLRGVGTAAGVMPVAVLAHRLRRGRSRVRGKT